MLVTIDDHRMFAYGDYRRNASGNSAIRDHAQLSDATDFFGMEMLYNTQDSGLGNTQLYNGGVSAVKWKNAGDGTGSVAGERSYKFAYDKTDKLLSATFQKYSTSWGTASNAQNEAMTYDHNGNILSLVRKQIQRTLSGTTVSQNPQTIDSLIYTYTVSGSASGNLLGKVADPTGNKNGFADGTNGSDDYTYDTQGNLTADQNKGIDSLKYNAQGKVARIKFHDGRLMVYTYDGAGTKLKTALTVSGTTTTTDYVNGFVYTNGALSFFSSPEGRVVKNGSSFEYQYAIADHQGNTRVVFTSATPTAQSVSAGFESANQTSESANFLNYPSGAHINTVVSNAHTGNNSLYLNGATNYQVGLAKTYTLLPGDQVQIQAYAKYSTPSGTSSNLTGFATALLNAFSLSAPASGETGTPSAGVNTYGGQAAAGFGDGSSDNTHPRVFVNILVFDKNYNFMDIAYQQTTSSGAQISATYTAKEAGYAYVYVSNEQTNQTDVYFDDITMTFTPTRILQVNEYYPFGLQTASSMTRPGSTNNFLYDAGNELNTATGFYDLPFRNYDASVGRFFQVDPLAHTSYDLTPYHYAGNNPIGSNDPSGLMQQYYANPEDDPRWQISHPPGGSGGGSSLTDAMDREFDTSWSNDTPVSTWWAEQTQSASTALIYDKDGNVVGLSFTGNLAGAVVSAVNLGAGITITYSPGGGDGGRNLVEFDLIGLVVNNSTRNLSDPQLAKIAAAIENQIESSFSGKSATVQWKMNASIGHDENQMPCDSDPFIFSLVDDVAKKVPGADPNAVGFSRPGWNLAYINATGNDIARTATHEFGHALGLGHIRDEHVSGRQLQFSNDDYFGNLMHQSRDLNSNGNPVAGYQINAWQIYEVLIRTLIIPYQINPMK